MCSRDPGGNKGYLLGLEVVPAQGHQVAGGWVDSRTVVLVVVVAVVAVVVLLTERRDLSDLVAQVVQTDPVKKNRNKIEIILCITYNSTVEFHNFTRKCLVSV